MLIAVFRRAIICSPFWRHPADYSSCLSLLPVRAYSSTSAMASQIGETVVEPKRVPIPPNGVDYRGKVVLAPMVRSGELPSRLMALKYGADLVWGPETVDKAIIGTTRRINTLSNIIEFTRFPSNKRAPPKDSEGDNSSSNPEAVKQPSVDTPGTESVIFSIDPVIESQGKKLIFQVGTADPKLAVEAARMVASDVAGIDVNAGCPKPFSTSGGMGAALLKTPDLLCSILKALVTEIGEPFGIGISVKIRILATEEQTIELVKALCATGIIGLTVHCRMTHMRPRERAIRDQIPAIVATCHSAGVACLINGDVKDRADGLSLMEKFGLDGAMIATAAEKNPSVFSSTGMTGWKDIIPEYVSTSIRVANRWGNTKFLLAQMIPGKALHAALPAGSPINSLASTKSYSQIVTMMRLDEEGEKAEVRDDDGDDTESNPLKTAISFPFSPEHNPSLLARARALDSYLGLGAQVSRAEKKAKRRESELKIQEEAKLNRESKRQQRAWNVRRKQPSVEKENGIEDNVTITTSTSTITGSVIDRVNQTRKRGCEEGNGEDEPKRAKLDEDRQEAVSGAACG